MRIAYDFHLHSCLSPCGDAEMTPYNLVQLAGLLGYQAIALTDHNSCLNCPAAQDVSRETGITFLPGMELCTADEVHMVCLFPTLEQAMVFSDYVGAHSPNIKNRAEIFGEQSVVNAQDELQYLYEPLLTLASDISTAAAPDLVQIHGGVCFPAHIDRSSYSIISNLGTISQEMGFSCAELADPSRLEEMQRAHPALQHLRMLYNSDAHRLEDMRQAQHVLEVTENTPQAILDCLRSYITL